MSFDWLLHWILSLANEYLPIQAAWRLDDSRSVFEEYLEHIDRKYLGATLVGTFRKE